MGRRDILKKVKSIRGLIRDNQYTAALTEIKTLDLNEVPSIEDLYLYAELYEKAERMDMKKNIYYIIYERTKSRHVLAKLLRLVLRLGDLEEARELFLNYEFSGVANLETYELRYMLARAEGNPRSTLITILEELKQEEYTEEWGFQLARLYELEGRREDCIRECNDLKLWFGEGKIIDRAMELKKRVESPDWVVPNEEIPEPVEEDTSEYYTYAADPVEVKSFGKDEKTEEEQDENESKSKTEEVKINPSVLKKPDLTSMENGVSSVKPTAERLGQKKEKSLEELMAETSAEVAAGVADAVDGKTENRSEKKENEVKPATNKENKKDAIGETETAKEAEPIDEVEEIVEGIVATEVAESVEESAGVAEDVIEEAGETGVSEPVEENAGAAEDIAEVSETEVSEPVEENTEESEISETEEEMSESEKSEAEEEEKEEEEEEEEEDKDISEVIGDVMSKIIKKPKNENDDKKEKSKKKKGFLKNLLTMDDFEDEETEAEKDEVENKENDQKKEIDYHLDMSEESPEPGVIQRSKAKKKKEEKVQKLEEKEEKRQEPKKEEIKHPDDISDRGIKYYTLKNTINKIREGNIGRAHFVFAGGEERITLAVAKRIAKELNHVGYFSAKSIVKISADKLNNLELEKQIEKVKGGCMLVTHAAELNKAAVNELIDIIDRSGDKIVIMLSGAFDEIDCFLAIYPDFAFKFNHKIRM